VFELGGRKTVGIGRASTFWLAGVAHVSTTAISEVVGGPKGLLALEEDNCVMFRGVVMGFPAKDDGVTAAAEGGIAGKGWVAENARMRSPLGVRAIIGDSGAEMEVL